MKNLQFLFALALASAALPAAAQVYPGYIFGLWQQGLSTWREGVTRYQIHIENDSLLLKRDDGMYTSGARYQVQSWQSDAKRTMMSEIHLAHDFYTPLDIKLAANLIPLREHPYAAWLAIGASFSEWQSNGSMYSLGLELGCIGPCAGGEHVQKGLHRLINQPLPQGWSRQIRNEWGVIGQLQWAGARWEIQRNLDLQANAQLRLGNINTDATLGALLRFGSLNQLPSHEASFGFLQTQVRAVGYDAAMQGGYFSKNNPHTVTPKRAYGQIELGWQWQGPEWGGKLAFVRRGNTIADLPNSLGAQNYAIVQLNYTLGK